MTTRTRKRSTPTTLSRPALWLCAALLAQGCAGSIEGEGATAGGGSGGTSRGGAPGAAGAGGGGAGANGGQAGSGPPRAKLDDGRVTARRLNRAEYNNSVRDLLGTSLRPADRFPADEVDHGFDTIGDAVSFSPLHADQTEAAAFALADELVALPAGDPRRTRVLSCQPAAGAEETCVREIVTRLGRRAFRRPLAKEEVDRFAQLFAKVRAGGAPVDDGLRALVAAVLVSPHFLLRIERDPDPGATAPRPVNDHELAARLSYFLWASLPDAELDAAADGGKLTKDPAELGRQLTRMLADPKAQALVEHFAGQWLFTRAIDQFEPQKAIFKTFDDKLKASMRRETELFVKALLDEDAPLDKLLLAEFSFADDRLAKHYGLPAAGTEPARVSLAGTPRVGLLTQGSVLLMTSQPDRTSPVKRGAWVLDQLLCAPPPPPPPNVEGLPAPKMGEAATVRQRLERHRADPMCGACHAIIDPIGFGLEHFDAVGAYRTTDNGAAVDPSGQMPDGTRFAGPRELGRILAKDPRFVSCAVEQMLTYAVGRGFRTATGHPYVEALAGDLRASGAPTWKRLVTTIVTSEAFRTRRAVAP